MAEVLGEGAPVWQMWVVSATIVLALVLMILESRPPEHIMLGALALFWNLGIIPTEEVLRSFGNSSVMTIGSLFVVVQAVDRSKLVARFISKILGRRSGEFSARLRLCLACFCFSSLVSNTPLVALFLPIVREWARHRGFAASKFLMPLSQAVIMGGLLTVIGTSTNLLVNGFLEQQNLKPLGFFEPGFVALPVGLAALAYVVIVGHRLLPDNRGGLFRELRERGDHLVTALELTPDSHLVGRGVYEVLLKCGLPQECLLKIRRQGPPPPPRPRRPSPSPSQWDSESRDSSPARRAPSLVEPLTSLDVASAAAGGRRGSLSLHPSLPVDAGSTEIFPVPDHETVQVGDRLVLSISRDALIDLVSSQRQAVLVSNAPALQVAGPSSEFVELVLGFKSPAVGQPVSQGAHLFESTYRAGLIAVRRRGDLLGGASGRNLREAVEEGRPPTFSAGDTVLVLAPVGTQFSQADFLLVTRVAELPPSLNWWDYLPLPLFFCGLTLVAFRVVEMVRVAVSLSTIFVLCGWVQASEVRTIIDWQLLMLIGASLGVSQAVQRSGLSLALAAFVKVAGVTPRGSLALLYSATTAMTEVITNNAAAALFLPLAVDVAAEFQVSARPFALAVMLAASTSFACPIGYTTNLMVLGPGGYSFRDFFRVGFAIDVIYLVGVSVLVPIIWPLE